MLSIDMVYDARNVIKPVAVVTPLLPAPKIGEGIYVKAENLQLTGSFKLRGATYKINKLTEEEKAKGIITCSAGNHAQAVALSAAKNGCKAVICMPAGAPLAKVNATKSYGAEVVLVEGVYDDAFNKATELQAEYGYTFAHPFNDDIVIAGQGTMGIEILEQLPDVDQVLVPIGGGGLISGIAFAIKTLKPQCRVVGVQAEGSPSMYNSRKEGKPIELTEASTIADGIIVKKQVQRTFDIIEKYVDDIVLVSENEIKAAMIKLMECQKLVAEGSGAVTTAAVMFGKVETEGKKTVCVVSGGNIDMSTIEKILAERKI